MTAPRNPHQHGSHEASTAVELASIERGVVTTVKPHQSGDDVAHHVFVRTEYHTPDDPAIVMANTRGDVQLPDVGDRVLVAYRSDDQPVVLGTLYARTDTVPPYDVGERVVGHPASDAEVRLSPSGTVVVEASDGTTVEVASNGTVSVNGGSTGVVTDVSAESRNSYNGITQLDITRSNDLFVP